MVLLKTYTLNKLLKLTDNKAQLAFEQTSFDNNEK